METQPPGDSEACGFIFLIGRKRRRVEPHAYVVVLRVLKVLRVLEDNKAKKINTIESEKPPFMG